MHIEILLSTPACKNAVSGGLHHPDTYPALEWILSNSRYSNIQLQSLDKKLFELFAEENVQALPVASLRSSDRFSLCADPVHLIADLSDLHLSENNIVLDASEKMRLSDELNEYINPLGYVFAFNPQGNGIIKMGRQLEVTTTPLSEVLGKGVMSFMPAGKDAPLLKQLMNEIQMFLHQSAFNKRRIERGLLPVNGLWLWGEGDRPQLIHKPYSRVYGFDEVESSLCRESEVDFSVGLPDNLNNICDEIKELGSDQKPLLFVLRKLSLFEYEDNPAEWTATMQAYQQLLFKPLKKLLQSHKISSLKVMTDAGAQFEYNRFMRFAFWRRWYGLDSYGN